MKPNTENKKKINNKEKIQKMCNRINDLEKLVKKYKSSHDKMLTLASNHNYIKRLQSQAESKINFANFEFAKSILTPVEWLEQTLIHSPKTGENSWLKGLEFILNKFKESLKSFGVNEISIKIGDKYNHDLAEIVDSEKSTLLKPNHIIKIKRKGYYFKNKILQHAQVIVSKI